MTTSGYLSKIQHTIAIDQVRQVLEGANKRDLDAEALLRRAGINLGLLDSKLARVTQSQYAKLIVLIARKLRDEFMGLSSHPVPMGTFSACCRMLVNNGNLQEALRQGLRYYHAFLPDFIPRLRVNGDVAYMCISFKKNPTGTENYAARVFMFFCYGLICWLAARRIPILEVVYNSEVRGRRSDASKLFQAPVIYVESEMGFRFDARWLTLPVVQNSQSVEEFLKLAPSNLLLKFRDQTSLTERIRRMLRRYVNQEMPSLEEVGEMLAMTPQTLRRHLRREGQGYQLIKDALRRDVAVEYLLHTSLTIPDVANRVGFSEVSTFHRAFKSWTGLTPGAYRNEHHLIDA